MLLSIIIVNYNSKDQADACLRSIFRFPVTGELEVFVVDNASRDGSVEYLQERWEDKTNLKFIRNRENLGFGKANNLALQQAQGQYVAILNPDVEVREGTLQRLVDYLEQNEKAGMVGPRLLYPDGVIQDSYRTFPNVLDVAIKRTFLKKIPFLKKRLRRYLMWDKDKLKTEPVDWLVGAFLVLRRSALDKVGLFDERFFLFFEDTDLCRRFHQAGYEVVYHPLAQAMHYHERLSAGGMKEIFTKKTVRIHIASGVKYFWKWVGK